MTYTFDKVIRGIVTLAVLTALYLILRRLSAIILPFLVAWVVAYMLNPGVAWLQRKMRLKSRALPVVIMLLVVCALIVGLVVLLVPAISGEIERGKMLFMNFWEQPETQRFVNQTENELIRYFRRNNVARMINMQTAQTVIDKVVPGVVTLVNGIWLAIGYLAVIAISFLYLIFIMIDYDNINANFREAVPHKYRTLVYGIMDDVESGMNSYFRGQSLVALLVGILFAIGFTIVGLPMGITVGLFIGVLNLVPYLQTIGIIPVAMLAALRSAEFGTPFWIMAVECAAVFLVVQIIQDMILVPKIMGKAMGLKPAIILLALSIWGSLLGFVGLIIALPLTSLIISYYKRYVLKKNDISFEIMPDPIPMIETPPQPVAENDTENKQEK